MQAKAWSGDANVLARLSAPLPDASLGHAALLVWSGRAFLPTKAPAAATLEGMKQGANNTPT